MKSSLHLSLSLLLAAVTVAGTPWAARAAAPANPTSSRNLRTLNVGIRPESVTRGFGGHLYVTVMNGQEVGDGEVRVVKGDKVEIFATGLDEPKGIAFTGDFLVATDLKRVWKIDANGRASVLASEAAFPVPISYLNDAAAAPDSRSVFVTDMGARDRINGPAGLWPLDSAEARALPHIGRVFSVSLDGKVTLAVDTSSLMPCPNGVAVDPAGGLLVAEFFRGNLLSHREGQLRVLSTGYRGADGIERGRDGSLYVSSWTQGKVWRLNRDGLDPEVILEGLQSAADFLLDEDAGVLIVPDMKAGTLIWLPLL